MAYPLLARARPGDRSHANGITLVDFALLQPITQYVTHPLSKGLGPMFRFRRRKCRSRRIAYYSLFLLQSGFFQNALSANDQLRQRVAFALSQMLVTSGLDVNLAYGTATYQQIFLDNVFGNYEDILTKVTLSSVMGDYLNMVNNDKPANGVNPNENYAREVAASLF
jgi:uncharacterized protein (DUF1800 family)